MRLRQWLPVFVTAWLALGSLASAADVAASDTVAVKAAAAPVAGPAPAAIAGSRAGDYVGQDVTVEGRVAAIHESPLATVIAFAPNFAGFTATILAADRDKFPADLEVRVRDHLVRVSGTVTAYRGKPEMALRDPAQLVLAPPPGLGAVTARAVPAPVATTDAGLDDIRRALTRIETRLESLEGRVGALEQAAPSQDDLAPAPRPER